MIINCRFLTLSFILSSKFAFNHLPNVNEVLFFFCTLRLKNAMVAVEPRSRWKFFIHALGFVSCSIYVVYRFHFTVKASVKTITSVSKLIMCYTVIKWFSRAIFWFSYKHSILIELTKKISSNLIIYLPCTILH